MEGYLKKPVYGYQVGPLRFKFYIQFQNIHLILTII
jgi:hypothetical protein